MAKKEQVQIDEAMMRGIMMKEVPVYTDGNSSGTKKESPPMDVPVGESGERQELSSTERRKPSSGRKKKMDEPGENYSTRFLINDHSKNRVSANISRELFQRIKKFLPVIAPDITLTSYLNNIISEHLESHLDEINELYNSEFEKPL
jgi:hypothetical protein